jgi:hypothetical protein
MSRRAEKSNEKAPDFRILSGQIEFGAACKETSSEGREYLSVKLDDPSLLGRVIPLSDRSQHYHSFPGMSRQPSCAAPVIGPQGRRKNASLRTATALTARLRIAACFLAPLSATQLPCESRGAHSSAAQIRFLSRLIDARQCWPAQIMLIRQNASASRRG